MTKPSRALLDTSVLVAFETGRPLDADSLPEDYAVSVVTLAEVQAGVLAAPDIETRSVRLETLEAIADVQLIPVDERVAMTWARLRALLAEAGRRVNVNDLWIAATAVTYGMPVVTQDGDFDAMEGLGGLAVIHV